MIGERLSDIRDEKSLTQEQMAKILKTSRSNYCKWENEKEFIPLKKLNLLCNQFDVNIDYIIGKDNNPKSNGKHELDPITIGKRLKQFRLKNNLTQKDLSNLLKTTQSTISAYESGKTILLTSFALQIYKTYNISLDWLCGRTK